MSRVKNTSQDTQQIVYNYYPKPSEEKAEYASNHPLFIRRRINGPTGNTTTQLSSLYPPKQPELRKRRIHDVAAPSLKSPKAPELRGSIHGVAAPAKVSEDFSELSMSDIEDEWEWSGDDAEMSDCEDAPLIFHDVDGKVDHYYTEDQNYVFVSASPHKINIAVAETTQQPSITRIQKYTLPLESEMTQNDFLNRNLMFSLNNIAHEEREEALSYVEKAQYGELVSYFYKLAHSQLALTELKLLPEGANLHQMLAYEQQLLETQHATDKQTGYFLKDAVAAAETANKKITKIMEESKNLSNRAAEIKIVATKEIHVLEKEERNKKKMLLTEKFRLREKYKKATLVAAAEWKKTNDNGVAAKQTALKMQTDATGSELKTALWAGHTGKMSFQRASSDLNAKRTEAQLSHRNALLKIKENKHDLVRDVVLAKADIEKQVELAVSTADTASARASLLKYRGDQPLETMALRLREQHQSRLKETSVHDIDHLKLVTDVNNLSTTEQNIIMSHMENIIEYDGGNASEYEYMYKTLLDLGHIPPNTDIRKCIELNEIHFENLAGKKEEKSKFWGNLGERAKAGIIAAGKLAGRGIKAVGGGIVTGAKAAKKGYDTAAAAVKKKLKDKIDEAAVERVAKKEAEEAAAAKMTLTPEETKILKEAEGIKARIAAAAKKEAAAAAKKASAKK